MISTLLLRLSLPALVLALLGATAARAQVPTVRILDGVHIERAGDRWDVVISFSVPVQVLRHAPESRGDEVTIQLAELGLAGATLPRESLSVARDAPVPVASVTWEAAGIGGPSVDVRFRRTLDFEVLQGRDLRSVVVRVAVGPPRRAAPEAEPRAAAAPDEKAAVLVDEGRRAFTAGEFERAALIFQAVLDRPESDQTPTALELLGLARERAGQLAHAVASYEEYLRRYPDGEGAARVRQRLDALVTARAEPRPERREGRSEQTPRAWDFEGFGSLYVGYRRASQILDGLGDTLFDSSLYTDLYASTRLRTASALYRTKFQGSYRREFAQDAGGDETRVSSAFVSFEQAEGGLSGSIGRRSRSDGGVLGRYDGAELAYRGGSRWKVGVLGGMPVDSSRWSGFQTDRFLGGANVEFGPFWNALDVSLYGVGQTASGLLDRAAVGGEIRYFREGMFVVGFFDYDVHFKSLNLAQVTGNWQITPSTAVNGYFDYRNAPFLTTRNALVGQPVGGLGGLEDLFPADELEQLAEDRTVHATTFSAGLTQRLSPKLQLALDFTGSDFSGSETSGGVVGFPGSGLEFSYLAQLLGNDLTRPGELVVGSLRYFDGSHADVASAGVEAREPITRFLRATPRFYALYQRSSATQDLVALRPSLRFDVFVWKLSFDAEGGIEWSHALTSGPDPPWGYYMNVGVRYDF